MRRGFSLLELSIALILAGLMAGIGLSISSANNRTECYTKTSQQLKTIKEAVERFAMKHDRFPMPAPRHVGVEDTKYGREATTAQIAAGEIDQINGASFGSLPFQTLGIPVENASDCWGNKFTYAVTTELTETTKFLNALTLGKLTIKTSNTITFLNEAGYAIISHGADGLGAVKNNYSGSDKKWCVSDGTIKTQNCDVTNTDLVSTEFNDGKNGTGNFFDDIIVYRGKPWRIGGESNLFSWGTSALGDGVAHPGDKSVTPVRVKLPAGAGAFTAVSAGYSHSCALANDNKAYCWGSNVGGYLGNNTVGASTLQPVPVLLPGATGFLAISAADLHSCALTDEGQVYCWGKNSIVYGPPTSFTVRGMLGNGTSSDSPLPVKITNPSGVNAFRAISTGFGFSCAIGDNGKVYCWGANQVNPSGFIMQRGQIGQPTAQLDSLVPVEVPMPAAALPFKTIESGSYHTCGKGNNNRTYCWGGNGWTRCGALGYGGSPACSAADYQYVPGTWASTSMPGGVTLTSVAGGNLHSCGLGSNNQGYCWGSNAYYALGNGFAMSSWSTRIVLKPPGVTSYKKIDAGNDYSCAIGNTDRVYCWGYNNYGTIGNTSVAVSASAPVETQLPVGISAAQISTGGIHAHALVGIVPPVNGGWGVWGPCLGACGGGAGTKTRSCTLGAPALCTGGAAAGTMACVTAPCAPPPPPAAVWNCVVHVRDSGFVESDIITATASTAAACAAACPGTIPGGLTHMSHSCQFF